jgi:hypothetical protein
MDGTPIIIVSPTIGGKARDRKGVVEGGIKGWMRGKNILVFFVTAITFLFLGQS